MHPRQIHRRLGIGPGETLVKLVTACEAENATHPHRAFDALGLLLPWLAPDDDFAPVPGDLSAPVHGFATAGEGVAFGFLVENRRDPDRRPVVRMEDRRRTIVAPSLHAFLGLVARAGSARAVERGLSDAEWSAIGQDTSEERERLVERLRTIVGVELPACPSEITDAIPERAADEPRPKVPGPATTVDDPNAAVAIGRWALDAGRLEHAAGHARNAIAGKAHDAARASSVLVLALVRLGRPSEAVAPLLALVDEWLDPCWRAPPRVHPRRLVTREELVRMLEACPVPDAARVVARVRGASRTVADPDDFF